MSRPIVQVSLRDFSARKSEIAKELWAAASEVGFFYLKDTGLSEVRRFLRRHSDRDACCCMAE